MSSEKASGNKKWREKLGGNANELLIMHQSLEVIKKKTMVQQGECAENAVFKSDFHLDFNITNQIHKYSLLFIKIA